MVKNYEAVKFILCNIFCDKNNLAANWRGLLLRCLHDDWLKCIEGYKELILSFNKIKSIPTGDIWNHFGSVEKLNLSSNKLQEIPPDLLKLPKLRNLNLSSNKLKHLPNVKEWSPYLTTLSLENNLLESFPSNVEGLPVKYLYIADNRLDCVPEGICNLKFLETLSISRNVDIHELPVSMGKLTRLNELALADLTVCKY